MNHSTKCFIPTFNAELKINSIKYGDYIKLNNYIQNSDFEEVNNVFNNICSHATKFFNELKNIDKFCILLHFKKYFFEPCLKLNAKNEDDKIVFDILIQNIEDKCKNYNIANFNLPSNLYYKDVSEILKETSQSIQEIKDYINKNKILMFEVPDFIKGVPKVYINCFDNTFFYFCKLLYSTNLNKIYQKIIFLKKNFNFLLEEIYEMNPKELDMFLKTK